MMLTIKELKSTLDECRRLIVAGKIDDAVRLSGETLAKADDLLRQYPDAEVADTFAEGVGIHSAALRFTGLYKDSFSLAIMALSQLNILKTHLTKIGEFYKMDILCNAMVAYTSVLDKTIPTGTEADNHVTITGEYMISLLYSQYIKCDTYSTKDMAPVALRIKSWAHDIINEYSQYITLHRHHVNINGQEISITDSPEEIYADLRGRALAAGLLKI